MFDREEFLRWNTLFGPVSVDACSDDQGLVAQTKEYFCPKRSFLGADVSGQTVWLNPPFDQMQEFLTHLVKCRDMAPSSTQALVVVPKWVQEPWYQMLKDFTLLHEYPSGTELFTYLNVTGSWEPAGPCPWPVQVWYMGRRPHIGQDGKLVCSLAQRSLVEGPSKTHDREVSQGHERCAVLT